MEPVGTRSMRPFFGPKHGSANRDLIPNPGLGRRRRINDCARSRERRNYLVTTAGPAPAVVFVGEKLIVSYGASPSQSGQLITSRTPRGPTSQLYRRQRKG